VLSCELVVQISESQRREIFEMEWLIDNITRNGHPEPRLRRMSDAFPTSK
jgi:hypothetical protein